MSFEPKRPHRRVKFSSSKKWVQIWSSSWKYCKMFSDGIIASLSTPKSAPSSAIAISLISTPLDYVFTNIGIFLWMIRATNIFVHIFRIAGGFCSGPHPWKYWFKIYPVEKSTIHKCLNPCKSWMLLLEQDTFRMSLSINVHQQCGCIEWTTNNLSSYREVVIFFKCPYVFLMFWLWWTEILLLSLNTISQIFVITLKEHNIFTRC